MRLKSIVLSLVAGASLGIAGCGEEPVPLLVSYERDVKPLMNARCIRCHGAGGTLNLDPDSMPVLASQVPTNGYFTQLADVGTGHGLAYYTVANPVGYALMKAFLPQMPPAPAPKLTDREFEIIATWAANPLP